MRRVKIRAPKGSSEQVSQVAFQVGIAEVSVHQEEIHKLNQLTDCYRF